MTSDDNNFNIDKSDSISKTGPEVALQLKLAEESEMPNDEDIFELEDDPITTDGY